MFPTASTTAWALHDLGLATSFGGSIFGKLALHPALKNVSDAHERGEVIHAAWKRFSLVNLLSHGVFAATWLAGRSMLTGREVDRTTRNLVRVKDGLIVASLVSGLTSMIAGERGSDSQDAVPSVATGSKPAREVSSVAGTVNLILIGGILGVTAILAMKAGTSSKWSFLSRLIP